MRQTDRQSGVQVCLNEMVIGARSITNPLRAQRMLSPSGPVKGFAGAAPACSAICDRIPIRVTLADKRYKRPCGEFVPLFQQLPRLSPVDPVWHTPLVNGL